MMREFRLGLVACVLLALSATVQSQEDDPQRLVDSILKEIATRAALNDFRHMSTDSLTLRAESGNAEAQLELAERYFTGNGVAADHGRGIYWYGKAADAGNKWAQGTLGTLYWTGNGVAKNYDSAARWIDLAANQDNGYAQAQKAFISYVGASTAADTVRAYMWARLASLSLYGNDALMADSLKNGIKTTLTAEQVSAGDSMAMSFLTDLLEKEKGTSDTMRIIRNLASAGWPDGEYRLALNYFFDGASDSLEQVGLGWIRKAAEHGHSEAQCVLGVDYRDSRGVPMDDDSAYYWIKQSADQGNPRGQVELGFLYQFGKGVKKDPKAALSWYKKSAAQNLNQGIHWLGAFYWSDAPKKNKIRAWALLKLAESRFQHVNIVALGEAAGKMNDKEQAEAEQLRKDLDDETKIKGIIESWVD